MEPSWPGAVNVWRVNPGLYRMGRREWLTAAGWAAARRDGVRSVVDLRADRELTPRATDPLVAAADLAGIEVLRTPTEDPDAPEFEPLLPYLDSPVHYPFYVDAFGDRVARAVLTVAEAPGGVVVHCSAGRDRTGLVVGLGQLVAGVPAEAIVAGWVRAAAGVNDYHRDHHHPRERHLAGAEFDDYLAPRVAGLERFLAEVDAAALLRAHGATPAQLAAVARRFSASGADLGH